MEAYHIDRSGSVDGIVWRGSEDPRPGPKEILIRVPASSLNYRDPMGLKGGGRGPKRSASYLCPTGPVRSQQSPKA
jgi:NADPH:quinone reductase-like Zn-dependent oxidoreductase